MNKNEMDKLKTSRSSTQAMLSGVGMLIVGIALLVLGGMNLFINVFQIWQGMWQQNIILASILMILVSAVPAGIGALLVFRSTAIPQPGKNNRKETVDTTK